MALHRLSSIEVGVPAEWIEKTRGFYRELGLSEVATARFATRDGGEQLEVVAATRRGLSALTIGVDDADDLGRAAVALAKLGIETQREGGVLRAREPVTGIRVALAIEPRATQQESEQLATNGPGRIARRNDRSAAVYVKDAPRPRRLSHAVTTSPDSAASRRFFTEGLGFQVSDEIPAFGASFMRCSTDHHNLLIQQGPFATLHHVAWEMDDVDSVGRAAAAMVAADPSRHVWGLGRHAIGSNYFWYLRDPAGNFHEYTSDLDVIDEAEAWRAATTAQAPHAIAIWGPPVPREFLLPDDIAALAQAQS
jgi:catechol 2,3-dioxygenase-like lactoylglutathione lyase family enzyme